MRKFHIPKHTFDAAVRLPGSAPLHVSFFLGECAADHGGPERPSDLLNGPARFLPAMDQEKRVVMVNLDLVTMISVAVEDEYHDPREEYIHDITSTIVPIEVDLADGTHLTGRVQYDLPDTRRRLQDYLNLEERFLTLIENHVIRFINRRHIARVQPLEEMEETCQP